MVGERLRVLRISKSMTQGDLAKVLGVSASSIGMYEQGRREPDNELLIRMSRVFEVSVDELLGVSEPEVIRPQELTQFIEEFLNGLVSRDLTVDDKAISRQDIEKIADSIRLGVEFSKREIIKNGGSNERGN